MVLLIICGIVLFVLLGLVIGNTPPKKPEEELPILTGMEEPKGFRRGSLTVVYAPAKDPKDYSTCPKCGSCYSFRDGICYTCNPIRTASQKPPRQPTFLQMRPAREQFRTFSQAPELVPCSACTHPNPIYAIRCSNCGLFSPKYHRPIAGGEDIDRPIPSQAEHTDDESVLQVHQYHHKTPYGSELPKLHLPESNAEMAEILARLSKFEKRTNARLDNLEDDWGGKQ